MAHNLHITETGKVSFAFVGSRNNIWHRLGNELPRDASIADWLSAAGLDHTVERRPCMAMLADNHFVPVPNRDVLCRSDNNAPLGIVSRNKYNVVQPRESLEFCFRYVGVDERFQMSAAGALGNGEIIWATANYNGDFSIAGEKHTAHILFSTSFDTTKPTNVRMTLTRTVCQNTLAIASLDSRACVSVRHSQTFDHNVVAKQLIALAKSVETYKSAGDAMAQNAMSEAEISAFFKSLLSIPADAKRENISTRKFNQFVALSDAYAVSVQEGAPRKTSWSALQAVTRYVDHDRGGERSDDAKFESAVFGSGAAMKEQAMAMLLPRVREKVLIAA